MKAVERTFSGHCREYKRRWLMLAIFVLCSSSNAMHWIQYSIISNITTRYFGVSSRAISWTALVFEACYIPFVFPASWVLDRYGLRVTLISGAAIMVSGAWLKVLSLAPNCFYLVLFGQALVGTAQIFILGVPARLAAVWFGTRQVSTACALGVIGNQVGVALSFLIPPVVVKNHEKLEDIEHDLKTLCYGLAVGPTAALVLLLLFFQKEPPLPPSTAQAILRCQFLMRDENADRQTYMQTLKSLLTNRNFVLLLLSYGTNVGVFYIVSTLLNQMLLLHFAGAEEDAGRIGLTIVLAGMVGSIMGGIVLDRRHWFKQCTLVVSFMSTAGMLIFTFMLTLRHIWLIYLIGAFFGFFMIGYLGIGFEFAAELTYPIPEGTSSGILIVTSELFGIIFTVIGGEMLNTYGDMVTNFTLVGLLAVGFITTMLINGTDLRRLAATTGIRNQTTQHALTCQVSDCSFKPSVMHDSTIFSTSHLS